MAIAKMMRIFMVGASAHRDETMRFLQGAGVIHPEPVVPLTGDHEKQASAALLRLRRLGQIEQAVGRYRNLKENLPVDCSDGDLAERAERILSDLQELKIRKQVLERLEEDLAPWGDFEPERLRLLEERGVYVRRWRMERKKAADLIVPENVFAEVVSETQGLLFYTVATGSPVDMAGASPLPIPEKPLSDVRREIGHLNEEIKTLAATLAGIALRADALKAQVTGALNEARYRETMGTLHAEEYLFGLQGWVPADRVEELIGQIKSQTFPLQVEVREPLPEEEPPVLLKNNWFIRRIEPLLKLYGIPNYREWDPSYFFAPFMILFFGICLSDAGYGLVFFLLSLWLEKKLGPKIDGLSLVMKLCQAFALATMAVGLLTGSIFGYNFENREWILIDVAVGVGNPMIFFYLALGLGVLQLSIAYILGAVQAPNWQAGLQKLGLMAVLWGGVLLTCRNVWFAAPEAALNVPLYYGGIVCLTVGVLITLLFSSEHRKWGVRLGIGLWSVYGLTSLIGDLLSYARLFGLGIATSAIAAVMNQLAGMIYQAAGPYLGSFFGILVIILGHTFNLLLSLLGSTVHSARLHFVEAFKNFYRGGGTDYQPFKIERG
ncbi:MAG: V-type ATPase 116kDa subunit family protein [Syntrophales bacterium]|nr:V-type ATPase 116kDa subunit family protein [Syntrophales bacterium]